MMFPQQWSSPCGNQCTHKYAALMQIPWRVFCKKGCDADGDTWEDCLGECNEICYKDPVLKDHQWSAYIDRSPGAENYSTFSVSSEIVSQVHPNRPPKPCLESKPQQSLVDPPRSSEDLPCTSA
ncbi:uncharacterized protein LOC116253504 isoform X2 [Nymphaea colorata]|uniref:uncharacterized protein LOC116253504 isoform X2 n=1 Tax=Nymphaea colorata TaxID=210225 RepID=UPI00129D6E40|nr:uncharacterized protein LOC116253504 isoform X2 [Nymphaea colorata]